MPSIYYELGAVAVGLIAFYFVGKELVSGYRSHKRNQLLESSTAAHPGEVTPGETAVVGTVAASEPLEVPIGDGECAAYYLDMFLGPNDEGFPFEDETEAVPFRLEGQHGAVTVDPENIAIEATAARTKTYSNSTVLDDNPDDLPEELLAFLDSKGVPIPEGWGGVNYTQKHVPIGDTACVYGTVEERDGELVVTGDDTAFFVADGPPSAFLDQRPSVWKHTLKEAGMFLVFGVVFLLGGLILLAA